MNPLFPYLKSIHSSQCEQYLLTAELPYRLHQIVQASSACFESFHRLMGAKAAEDPKALWYSLDILIRYLNITAVEKDSPKAS